MVLRLCSDVVLCTPDGVPVAPPLGAKTLGLLAFLALEPGPHRREELTALLWGDSPEEKARAIAPPGAHPPARGARRQRSHRPGDGGAHGPARVRRERVPATRGHRWRGRAGDRRDAIPLRLDGAQLPGVRGMGGREAERAAEPIRGAARIGGARSDGAPRLAGCPSARRALASARRPGRRADRGARRGSVPRRRSLGRARDLRAARGSTLQRRRARAGPRALGARGAHRADSRAASDQARQRELVRARSLVRREPRRSGARVGVARSGPGRAWARTAAAWRSSRGSRAWGRRASPTTSSAG